MSVKSVTQTLSRSIDFKLAIERIGSHCTKQSTFEPRVALVAAYRGNLRLAHQSVHPTFAAEKAAVPHVLGDVAVAINAATFEPVLLDLRKQLCILLCPLADRFGEPGIEPGSLNFQHAAHGSH